jgi:hypothetical protein
MLAWFLGRLNPMLVLNCHKIWEIQMVFFKAVDILTGK